MDDNDKGFKYTGRGRDDEGDREQSWLAQAVGMLLLVCICVLAITGTIALAKWMLGV
jgi:hypothetical protein